MELFCYQQIYTHDFESYIATAQENLHSFTQGVYG